MSEAVKVVVRCRPMSIREKELRCKSVVGMDPGSCLCHLTNPSDPSAPPKSFRFDGVYDHSASTEHLYNDVAYALIEGVPEGYNCTVFAYGQTGCGKSFTMAGPVGSVGSTPEHRGLVPRALEQLFEAAAVSEAAKFLLSASFLEIHNEEVRDLLRPEGRRLELREHPERGVYVHELSSHAVHNREQCLRLMEQGWTARATGSTLMNAESSRSHCIFSVSVERMDVREAGGSIRRGKLNLVDLAGSERQTKTGASGERLKEATKINLSLSALGNVISALVDGRAKHIPYRDSKLTRLLQDSLGGNTKTLMVACLSPADYNYDETLSTLRYAHRAKSIENKPRVNEDPKDAMLRQYQQEIEQLRRMLACNSEVRDAAPRYAEAEAELRMRYEQEVSELRAQCEAEQRTKEQLQLHLDVLRSQYAQQLAHLAGSRKHSEAKADECGSSTDSSPDTVEDAPAISPVCKAVHAAEASTTLTASQREVLARLRALQATMVGGEKAHDAELRERRLRQRRAAERRLTTLASALGRGKDDEDLAVLQVYDDIEHELEAKGEGLRRARAKIRAQEREIKDLQSEFESERTDYLETIRRQDRQLRLLQQVATKMAAALRPECNYSDLDRIKSEAVWSDDAQRWRLPELIISRTKLPPPGPTSPPRGPQPRAPSLTGPARVQDDGSPPGESSDVDLNSPTSSASPQDTLMQKLERSEQENLAGTYFKPKRAAELLSRAREEAGRAASHWKDAVARSRGGVGSGQASNHVIGSGGINALSSGSGGGSPLQQALNLASSLNNNLNSSWGNNNPSWTAHSSGRESHSITPPDLTPMRKPTRLEALPVLDKSHGQACSRVPGLNMDKPAHRKRAKAELNTMDLL